MKKNIREYFGLEKERYYEICREEQNLCALLYHLILADQPYLARFLGLIGCSASQLDDVEIYVEYAGLRDLWNKFGKRGHASNNKSALRPEEKNKVRRQFILDKLGLNQRKRFEQMEIQDFNRSFVSSNSNTSPNLIQSPATWQLATLAQTFPEANNEEFIRASRLKWCFNAKPDIVIFTSSEKGSLEKAVVIEAKFESRESAYPSGKEWKKFGKRYPRRVWQTEIQKQAFELLGFDDAHHVFIDKKGFRENGFSWSQVFNELGVQDANGVPGFIKKQIASALNR
jgi:hypothetical protein